MTKLNRFLFTDWNIIDINNPHIWENIYYKVNAAISESQLNMEDSELWDIIVKKYNDIAIKYFNNSIQTFKNWLDNHDDSIVDKLELILVDDDASSSDIAGFIESLPSWVSYKQYLVDVNQKTPQLTLTELLSQFFSKIQKEKILSLTIDKIIFLGGTDSAEIEKATTHIISKNCKLIQTIFINNFKGEMQQIKIFGL
jgi:hypothetical protein